MNFRLDAAMPMLDQHNNIFFSFFSSNDEVPRVCSPCPVVHLHAGAADMRFLGCRGVTRLSEQGVGRHRGGCSRLGSRCSQSCTLFDTDDDVDCHAAQQRSTPVRLSLLESECQTVSLTHDLEFRKVVTHLSIFVHSPT
jgi:hypothetical protein